MLARIRATPIRARPCPNASAVRRGASTPFWNGSTQVSRPTSGRAAASAAPRSCALVARITASAGASVAGSSVSSGRRATVSPPGSTSRSPPSRIAARCAPRATTAGGVPAAASRAAR